jgi:caffeoyl-CoA O-methyltransferase
MADAPKHTPITPALHEYLVAHGSPPDAVQRSLIEATAKLGPIAMMQIAPEQGGVDGDRPAALGARGRRPQDRAHDRACGGLAARAAA